jgi:cell division control protein 45
MKNWNLYDSIYYSNYLSAKLGIWGEKGKKEIEKFLAIMGIPLE